MQQDNEHQIPLSTETLVPWVWMLHFKTTGRDTDLLAYISLSYLTLNDVGKGFNGYKVNSRFTIGIYGGYLSMTIKSTSTHVID